ncbi:MAG: ribosomal L7Ae/L30e/S12e/Gadd45 family protein [Peptococcaceae bacterium]
MCIARLKKAKKKTVGTKQTLKAVQQGMAKVVYIAQDAQSHVINPIIQACSLKNIPVIKVNEMLELGKTCGIEVGCAAASVVEEEI